MPRKIEIADARSRGTTEFKTAYTSGLANDKRLSGGKIAAIGVAALVLIGGVVVFTSNSAPEPVAVAAEPSHAAARLSSALTDTPVAAARTDTATPVVTDLGAQTLQTLTQVRLSQSMLVQEEAQVVSRAAAGISAALQLPPPAPETPTVASNIARILDVAATREVAELPAPEVLITIDCNTELSNSLRTVSLPFAVSSTAMSETETGILADIVTQLNKCETARLMINGHSDATGEDLINMQLSWQRADATMARMIALGAKAAQLEAVGFGARIPLKPDGSPEDAANRRVDFRVLAAQGTNG